MPDPVVDYELLEEENPERDKELRERNPAFRGADFHAILRRARGYE